MKWKFLNTDFNTGKFNMGFDNYLVKNSNPEEAVLRLYKWEPYCISIGANQDFISINSAKAQNDNIDIVKRPTGGRAILHAEELTYSVIYPIDFSTSARTVYHDINIAILEGLKLYHPLLGNAELENNQPNLPHFYKNDEKSIICFAVSAKSELKFEGKKLVGSAQRKLGNSLLQHGSILCGNYHTKIVDYLQLNGTNAEDLKDEIEKTTIDLNSILNEEINYNILSDCLLKGFEIYFNTTFEKSDLQEFLKINSMKELSIT